MLKSTIFLNFFFSWRMGKKKNMVKNDEAITRQYSGVQTLVKTITWLSEAWTEVFFPSML